MAYELEREDSGFRVTFHEEVTIDESIAAVAEMAAADPRGVATYLLADMQEVTGMDFEIADLHRLAVAARMGYQRAEGFRLALFAVSNAVASEVALFDEVRSFLTGATEGDLAELAVFDDVDAARAWVAEVSPPLP